MRNLLLFLLVLIGVYYIRRLMSGDGNAPPEQLQKTPAQSPDGEQVLPCARCDVLVPTSEGVEAQGQFYCSSEHARLGPSAG